MHNTKLEAEYNKITLTITIWDMTKINQIRIQRTYANVQVAAQSILSIFLNVDYLYTK